MPFIAINTPLTHTPSSFHESASLVSPTAHFPTNLPTYCTETRYDNYYRQRNRIFQLSPSGISFMSPTKTYILALFCVLFLFISLIRNQERKHRYLLGRISRKKIQPKNKTRTFSTISPMCLYKNCLPIFFLYYPSKSTQFI